MKLNKKERETIDDAINILESIKEGKKVYTETKTLNNIKKVLGFDIRSLNKKKDIRKCFRGKEQHIIEHYNTNAQENWAREIATYFYFPFQIKELKDEEK